MSPRRRRAFDPATGVFAVTVQIPNPNGAAQRKIAITVTDDVGNAATRTVTVTHGALADLADVALLVGDASPVDGNIPIPAAGAKQPLSLLGVTSDGMRFVLPDDLVTFDLYTVEGEAAVRTAARLRRRAARKAWLPANMPWRTARTARRPSHSAQAPSISSRSPPRSAAASRAAVLMRPARRLC